MARVVINVPDDKLNELNETLTALGYTVAEEEFAVPEWHKKIVLSRINTTSDTDYRSWEEVKNKLKEKYGMGN
jgi:hypothetical protein